MNSRFFESTSQDVKVRAKCPLTKTKVCWLMPSVHAGTDDCPVWEALINVMCSNEFNSSDCYLFWLDTAGRLVCLFCRLSLPGSHRVTHGIAYFVDAPTSNHV